MKIPAYEITWFWLTVTSPGKVRQVSVEWQSSGRHWPCRELLLSDLKQGPGSPHASVSSTAEQGDSAQIELPRSDVVIKMAVKAFCKIKKKKKKNLPNRHYL